MIFDQQITEDEKAKRAKAYLFDSQDLAKKVLDTIQGDSGENTEITPVHKFAIIMVTLAIFGNNIAETQQAILSAWHLLTELEEAGDKLNA